MIENLPYTLLQEYWWLLVSVIGSLLVFLLFVQGGQTLLFTLAHTEDEKTLLINSLGRKWELGFTTLVLFGGALFAAFPLFYAVSFGGAYYFWMLVLFSFVVQAVAYEYRTKPDNFLGAKTFEIFLLFNGVFGATLLGGAVATFFSGSSFMVDDYRVSTWLSPWKGLEALASPFNLSLGLSVFFLSRVLGGLYFINNVDHEGLYLRAKKSVGVNFLILLPFLLYFLFSLVTRSGYSAPLNSFVPGKFLQNLLELHIFGIGFLFLGVLLVLAAVIVTSISTNLSSNLGLKKRGIWLGGLGTVLFTLSLFFTAGYKGSAYYSSVSHPSSSLTIYNSSSSFFTLTVMTYISMIVPFVLAYIIYTWRQMHQTPLTLKEMEEHEHY